MDREVLWVFHGTANAFRILGQWDGGSHIPRMRGTRVLTLKTISCSSFCLTVDDTWASLLPPKQSYHLLWLWPGWAESKHSPAPYTMHFPRPRGSPAPPRPQASRDISHLAQRYPPPASYRQGLAEQLCRLVLELISCQEGGHNQCSPGRAPLPSNSLALPVSSPWNNQM